MSSYLGVSYEAVYDFIKYNLIFNSNDGTGTVPSTNQFTNVDSVVIPGEGNLKKSGYDFNGWNTEANGNGTSYSPGAQINLDADTTLYAQWVPVWNVIKYQVIYNGNGSSSGSAPIDMFAPYNEGSSVNVLNQGDLVRDDYTFIGWNVQADGCGYLYKTNDTFVISENSTLYATWVLNGSNGNGCDSDNNGGNSGEKPNPNNPDVTKPSNNTPSNNNSGGSKLPTNINDTLPTTGYSNINIILSMVIMCIGLGIVLSAKKKTN